MCTLLLALALGHSDLHPKGGICYYSQCWGALHFYGDTVADTIYGGTVVGSIIGL